MKNGWTGGQYSLFRAAFGLFLLARFAWWLPRGSEVFSSSGRLPRAPSSSWISFFPDVLSVLDSPVVVTVILGSGVLLSLMFACGWHDRLAAIGLASIGACLIGFNPAIVNPGTPYLGWILLAHVCLPPAPRGSLAAAGRVDPDGGWKMPNGVFTASWILMALAYAFSGWMRLSSPSWLDGSAIARILESPLAHPGPARDLLRSCPAAVLSSITWIVLALELGFAPLALIPRLRPWIWSGMLGLHAGRLLVVQLGEPSAAMLLFHLFRFDPGWIRGRRTGPSGESDVVFYDGSCGLCHGFVRFILAEDRSQPPLRFAPLEGEAFRRLIPEAKRAQLPDSVVLLTPGGELLVRSRAVLRVLSGLGGLWRALAWTLRPIPAFARDLAYGFVARVRKRLISPPVGACPVIPQALRSRFL